MKLIAHRGGRRGAENSIDALIHAARLGADAVECDLRRTRDGVPGHISRRYTFPSDRQSRRRIGTWRWAEMKALLSESGRELLTFEALQGRYRENVPILLHIKQKEGDEDLASKIASSGLPLIAGVVSLPMLRAFQGRLPREQLLAFMESPSAVRAYWDAGAGILRLWEQWLSDIEPDTVRQICPGAEVFVMACNLWHAALGGNSPRIHGRQPGKPLPLLCAPRGRRAAQRPGNGAFLAGKSILAASGEVSRPAAARPFPPFFVKLDDNSAGFRLTSPKNRTGMSAPS